MGNDVGSIGPRWREIGGGEPVVPAIPDAGAPAGAPRSRANGGVLDNLNSQQRSGAGSFRLADEQLWQPQSDDEDSLRAARGRVASVGDLKSAMRFAKRYLRPDSRLENHNHRAELASALIRRMPAIAKATGKDKLEFCRYFINDVVSALPARQQLRLLVAFTETAPYVQDVEREMHRDALNYAQSAWGEGVINDDDYVRFLATLACSIGYGALFDEQLLSEPQDGGLRRLSDHPSEQARDAGQSSNGRGIELRAVVAAMLDVTPRVSAKLMLDWLSAVGRMTCDLPMRDEAQRAVREYARTALNDEAIDLNGYNVILKSLVDGCPKIVA